VGEGRRLDGSGWKANLWVRLDGDGRDSEVACGVWEDEGEICTMCGTPATGVKFGLATHVLKEGCLVSGVRK
jgi:hypothetical protein